ncbi:MAG: DeoR family transcriptional regulator, partial [Caldilineaceae bacterium]
MDHTRSTQRQEAVVQLLTHHGTLTVDALSDALGVSEWTVRRDLDHLKKRGVVARTVAESGITDSLEASGGRNHPAKVRI